MNKGTLLHILRNELGDVPNPLQTTNLNKMIIPDIEEAQKNRELLARFMNYYKLKADPVLYERIGTTSVPVAPEPYWVPESNPSHLLPVIDRIESGDYTVTVSKRGCIIQSDDYEFYPGTKEAYSEDYQGASRHNSAYIAIVSFLKWVKENDITV